MTGCSADREKGPPHSGDTAQHLEGRGHGAARRRLDLTRGVTTKISVPARSTEEEYFQACHAAKMWMQGHPGDRQALVERYLAAVQAPGVVGAGTWNIAWAALPLARQAAVIVAAKAAANDECG